MIVWAYVRVFVNHIFYQKYVGIEQSQELEEEQNSEENLEQMKNFYMHMVVADTRYVLQIYFKSLKFVAAVLGRITDGLHWFNLFIIVLDIRKHWTKWSPQKYAFYIIFNVSNVLLLTFTTCLSLVQAKNSIILVCFSSSSTFKVWQILALYTRR